MKLESFVLLGEIRNHEIEVVLKFFTGVCCVIMDSLVLSDAFTGEVCNFILFSFYNIRHFELV